jgi:hypothetical protein
MLLIQKLFETKINATVCEEFVLFSEVNQKIDVGLPSSISHQESISTQISLGGSTG